MNSVICIIPRLLSEKVEPVYCSLPARVLAYDAVAIVVFDLMVTRRRCKLGQHFCAFKVQTRAMHLT